jgi:hypothetical protein
MDNQELSPNNIVFPKTTLIVLEIIQYHPLEIENKDLTIQVKSRNN